MDGPVVPQASWESLYESNYAGAGDATRTRSGSGHWSATSNGSSPSQVEKELEEEKRMVEEWETAGLVRNDKTNMLVKVSSRLLSYRSAGGRIWNHRLNISHSLKPKAYL